MRYYKVLVASQQYHKAEPLVYSSNDAVPQGSIVTIPLQRRTVLGIVSKQTTRPSFSTKHLSSVVSRSGIPPEGLALLQWLSVYYPAPFGATVSLFAPTYLQGPITKQQHSKTQDAPDLLQQLPPLTSEQTQVISDIEQTESHSVLLHGKTGSGKTRVYIELAKQMLSQNKSVLILTPEIGLTSQLQQSVEQALPSSVITLHSRLTPTQRRRSWHRIATSKEALVVVGPRSALFSPLNNIGLVVVDEVHDQSYKQEQSPYYLADRVAAKLADLHNAKVVLGSATPPISIYFAFMQKGLPLLTMNKLAIDNSVADPDVEVISLRQRELFTQSQWLSNTLLDAIRSSIEKNEQALVFLNRRGSARLVICRQCDWQALCPRCDVPLTYHADSHKILCHICGYNSEAPTNCPKCRTADIVFRGIGTKSLTLELQHLFPHAVVERFDSDSVGPDRLEQRYGHIKQGDIDILVGTQMLGKGLDLPLLGVVGVVIADTSLYFPDYTADERTYQMINQVIGRVGRGHRTGTVVLQTYFPESPTLNMAIKQNYQNFYNQQIAERRRFHFPPYCYVLKLSCRRASQKAAQSAAAALAKRIQAQQLPIELTGPGPRFIERVKGAYTWQIIVKAKQRGTLLALIKTLPTNWSYDIDPTDLL